MKRMLFMVFAVSFLVNAVLFSLGYAQEGVTAVEPSPLWKTMMMMAMTSLLPPLWAAIGPVATAWITAQVNKFGRYVPRPMQVVISGLLTTAAAALSGDPLQMAQAAMAGATGQILAATDPATLRTTAPGA